MYVVLVEFTLNPEYAQAFRQRVRQQAQDSLREESECHVFDVCIDPARDDISGHENFYLTCSKCI